MCMYKGKYCLLLTLTHLIRSQLRKQGLEVAVRILLVVDNLKGDVVRTQPL